jgi:hypothetical protein
MRKKLLQFLKISSLLFVGFALGSVFGFREGQFAFYAIDAPPKGVLAMGNLKAIQSQNPAPVTTFLNSDIDQGLYYHSISRDQWWFSLFKMGLLSGSYEGNIDYVTRLAKYRKTNPAPNEDPTIFDQVPKEKEEYTDQYREMAKAHRDRLARIKAVIDEYAGN